MSEITGYISLPFHGENGKSAYEIATKYGYEGTEEEWLNSLGFIPEGSIGKEKFNKEVNEELESFATRGYVNQRSLRLPQFMAWKYPGKYGYAGQFAVEGKYVYLTRQEYIYKIDTSCEVEPVTELSVRYAASTPAKMATGLVINGDYIYVGTRRSTAGYPTEEVEGTFFVLKKSDLSIVTSFDLPKKISRLILHGNILIMNLQLRGWRIYDVTAPENPVMIYDEDFPENSQNSKELQGGEVFEHEGKVYYAGAGFGDGVHLFDITTPETPIMIWRFAFENYNEIKSSMHTYDLTVDFPYVYCTMGNESKYNADENRIQGILTLDLTDHLTEVPTTYNLSLIANEDKNNSVTDADTEPTAIVKIGDTIVVNNDAKGIALFDAKTSPQKPVYEGIFIPGEGSCVYRLKATDDGRLFIADGSKGAGKLYLVRGIK